MTTVGQVTTSLLDEALAYARRGWLVIPLHTMKRGRCTCGKANCESPGKHPVGELVPQGLKEATTDEGKITNWWGVHPSANIGIVTGEASGLVALDVDPKHGGDESLAALVDQHGPLPDTVESLTGGGGRHILFESVSGLKPCVNLGGYPGLDIRAEGSYIVAPPSSHISGRRYQWEASSYPDDTPLAPMPSWMIDLASQRSQVRTEVQDKITEGARNNTLTSIAGTLRACGLSESAIKDALLVINDAQCEPPLAQTEVETIAHSVAKYEAGKIPESKKNLSEEAITNLVCMVDIEPEAVSWLWKPYTPKGKLTLLEGDPGIGKSWVSLAIATSVTLGKGLQGQEPAEPANVLIASAEDGLGDTIRPRLDAMGADVSRIFAIDGALTLDESGFALLETYIERVGPALLIIDPLVAYVGAAVDIHRANETRAVMAQLARLAEKFDVAILAVRHLTKGGMSKAIYRGLGSIDFTAACRSVLLAGCDAENPQSRALVHIKSNLALAGPSIGYELRDGGFYWTGESSLTAPQILAAESGETTSLLNEALSFLKDELADGALPAKDVYHNAEGIGISKRTLDRAKAQVGVTSRKQGEKGRRGGGVWIWELPDDLDCQDCHTKEFGDLNHFEAKKEVMTERPGNLNLETTLVEKREKAETTEAPVKDVLEV